MANPAVDYAAIFAATPSPCLVLAPDLVIADANDAYLAVTGRTHDDLVGKSLADVLPDDPGDARYYGAGKLMASFERVLKTRSQDIMPVLRYDVLPLAGASAAREERWWSPINIPVLGPDGTPAWILHRLENVTAVVHHRLRGRPPGQSPRDTEAAELYVRSFELQRLNEELRAAHAREREVALALQESMLQVPDLAQHPDIAVRYLPATSSLHVCGDWYDVADVSAGRFAVAVGDVVGHGLKAAVAMGMLRSALSAAIRASDGPAQALEVLSLYARSVEGALATTAVKVLIDKNLRLIAYSSAGHPPPILCHGDGTHDLLDKATDPPLGARAEQIPRPQVSLTYTPGDVLVLYTDGLIERRGEDIYTGLARLTGIVSRSVALEHERLADEILSRLGVIGSAEDDIALVVIRL
ncbi:PP2C family protein-serine/threonine phosphatase [Streptomyces sp. NPDC015171]|uniref:PP2C family protein-serine/threonine phosphatase n=1 Tax=Streptomyces sp. NPDC015171 TaxID=3364945 RepID=UPI0036FFF89D